MHFTCFLLKQMLGFKFNNQFYIDKALPFGCVICCSHFEQVATFLESAVKRCMKSGQFLHYLHDFLGGDRSYSACDKLMDIFRTCMADLCVPLAEEKTEGPMEVLCFLGLELDSIHMVVRIPKDKIEELVEKNQVYSDKTESNP